MKVVCRPRRGPWFYVISARLHFYTSNFRNRERPSRRCLQRALAPLKTGAGQPSAVQGCIKLGVLGQRAANSSICVLQEPPTVAFWYQRGPPKQAFPPITQCLVMISEPFYLAGMYQCRSLPIARAGLTAQAVFRLCYIIAPQAMRLNFFSTM